MLTAHPSFSAAPSTSHHHLVTHPPSKVLPATLSSFLCCITHSWRNTNITSCITSRGIWVNTSECAGKDNNEIVSWRYSFLTFFIPLLTFTWHLHFPEGVFDIRYEELLYGCHFLPFKPSGKVLPVTLALLWLKQKLFECFLGQKCCQLKVLKVLLMHLY